MSELLRSAISKRRRSQAGSDATGDLAHTISHLGAFCWAITTVTGVLVAVCRPRRVVVQGPSMIPTLVPGDRLVGWRSNRLRLGDLVVLVDPQVAGRLLVKRIVGLGDGSLMLGGDNSGASRDSRTFGELPVASVLGVVRYRYHPAEQSGRLARPPRSAPAITIHRPFIAPRPHGKRLSP